MQLMVCDLKTTLHINPSSRILFINCAVILMIFLSAISFFNISHQVSEASQFINKSGLIRGGIQRYTKLYFGNGHSELPQKKLVITNQIINVVLYFESNKSLFFRSDLEKARYLLQEWTYFSEEIKSLNDEEVLKSSERLWELSNDLVFLIGEKCQQNLNKIIFLNGVGVLCIVFLIIASLYIKYTIQKKIETQALYDPLTKIYNRNYLDHFYKNIKKTAAVNKNNAALLLCDIDHFKSINDRFGHNKGDTVLVNIARLLLRNLRENDLVVRYGGEEFLVLVMFNDESDLIKVSERLRTSIEHASLLEIQVTISIGVYIIKDSDILKSAVHHADEALYTAKQQGRNQVRFYSSN